MTFFDRYVQAGSPKSPDRIHDLMDDMIEEWHYSDSPHSLPKYLGFSHDEYGEWVSKPDFILDMLKVRNLLS